MKVIDISAWQEYVDWGKLKTSVDGVILKLGEGKELDDMFISHVNGAVSVGLPYGIYYYGHASTPHLAQLEAKWVNNRIKEYLNGANPPLGIWYDAEDDDMLDNDEATETVSAFICTLNVAGYDYVGVYSSWNWLSKDGANYIDLDRLADYVPIWVAQYGRDNDLKIEYPYKNIKIWQNTDCSHVYGIPGGVDSNIYYD